MPDLQQSNNWALFSFLEGLKTNKTHSYLPYLLEEQNLFFFLKHSCTLISVIPFSTHTCRCVCCETSKALSYQSCICGFLKNPNLLVFQLLHFHTVSSSVSPGGLQHCFDSYSTSALWASWFLLVGEASRTLSISRSFFSKQLKTQPLPAPPHVPYYLNQTTIEAVKRKADL